MKYISLVDLTLGPIILFFIIMFSILIRNRRIGENPEYKYYLIGLSLKLFGGISLVLVYSFYYDGGDTHAYFNDGVCYSKLMFSNIISYMDVMINGINWRSLFLFDDQTGIPTYYRDSQTYNVVRITNLIVTLSFRSFVVTTLIISWISFIGIWKMYKVFYTEFPHLNKQMAIAVLFIPSAFFWGSGLLKDTITYSALGYFVYSFYFILVKKNFSFGNIITILASIFVIISIKPYILVALLPSSILWIFIYVTNSIKGSMVRYLAIPFLLLMAAGFSFGILAFLNSSMEQYSFDRILEKAVLTQQDLKSEHYLGNSFDIGDFDANLPSMLSKSHLALNAALYRPYIWEANNPVMFLSGLENLFFLFLTMLVIVKLKVYKIFTYASQNGLLIFSIVFSLFFAFSVGISTSNFGSLVRYKIPLIPFYIASLYILLDFHKKAKEKIITRKMKISKLDPVKT
ncbi:MAG: hypothetical protein HKO56_01405 [Bacteroidia bacterium]|nr:hypothetical protein [Bacteroidia bacterium]NNC86013.1 hypothetical protein [Bacteroidia bacterium]NNM15285.1 hypothetical protein [Bacteroidia bacterium]